MRARALLVPLTAAAVAVSGCGFHGLYNVNLPGGPDLGDHPYTVTVYFTDVGDLVPQSNVKVNDVAVGKVETINLASRTDPCGAGGWAARVKLSVNADVDLPANATARVEQTSLLGEKYVALAAPTSESSTQRLGKTTTMPRCGKGSIIPLEHTATAPEVEEVLGALSLLLNGGGLEQIQTIASELNAALKGNEASVRDLLSQLETFTGTLDKQKQDIVNALVSIDNLSKSLNRQKTVLVDTLNTLPQALHILAGDRDQLVTLLTDLSRLGATATDVVNSTETGLVNSLKDLDPTLVALAKAGGELPKALKIAGTFPFPLGTTRELVRGDYANLGLYLNLNLTDELCALANIGCTKASKSAIKAAQLKAGKASTASANSDASDALQPMLIGAGG